MVPFASLLEPYPQSYGYCHHSQPVLGMVPLRPLDGSRVRLPLLSSRECHYARFENKGFIWTRNSSPLSKRRTCQLDAFSVLDDAINIDDLEANRSVWMPFFARYRSIKIWFDDDPIIKPIRLPLQNDSVSLWTGRTHMNQSIQTVYWAQPRLKTYNNRIGIRKPISKPQPSSSQQSTTTLEPELHPQTAECQTCSAP